MGTIEAGEMSGGKNVINTNKSSNMNAAGTGVEMSGTQSPIS